MGMCHYSHSFYLGTNTSISKHHHHKQQHQFSTTKLVNVIPTYNNDIVINHNDRDYGNATKTNLTKKDNKTSISNNNQSSRPIISISTVVPEPTLNIHIIEGHRLDKSGLQFKEASHDINNFILAVKRGDNVTVERLISDGYDIGSIGMFGATPLIISCQYGHNYISNLILYHKSINKNTINHMNEKKVSALLYACMNGDVTIVQKLVDLGANPFPNPTLAIHNPTTDSSLSLTPLSIAIINGHLEVVKVLLDIRNDVNQVFEYPIVKTIFPKKNETNSPCNVTPLLLAAFYGQSSIVKEILNRSADWTLRDDENSTVLHHCCRLNDSAGMSIINIFNNHGCNVLELVNIYDKNGDTPLLIACDNKNVDIVSYLVSSHVDVNMQNKETGVTPLQIAIRRRNEAIVKILLNSNADPKIVDKKSTSAIDLTAKLRVDSEIYKLINNHIINEKMTLEDL